MSWLAEAIFDHSSVSPDSEPVSLDEDALKMNFVPHESVEGTFPYRSYFASQDHKNFFGRLSSGPVIVSLMEDFAVSPRSPSLSSLASTPSYRALLRSADVTSAFATLLDRTNFQEYSYRVMPKEEVKKLARSSFFGGLSFQNILKAIFPHIDIAHLREIKSASVVDDLLKMEEKTLSLNFKFGVVYSKENQMHESDMFSNEEGSQHFYQFLDCIGQRIRLRGFQGYRGGLDVKNDTTGFESYVSSFKNRSIMYHVSTLLPYSASNNQQIARKAQIGNDIGIIVYRDGPSCQPFDPSSIVSHFPHFYLVVTKITPTKYHVSCYRKSDVPEFSPKCPDGYFQLGPQLQNFVLSKSNYERLYVVTEILVINGEHASYKSSKFSALKKRTRLAILEDLASSFVSKERRLSLSGILRPSKPSSKEKQTETMPPPSYFGRRRLSVSSPEIPSSVPNSDQKEVRSCNQSEIIASAHASTYGSKQLSSIPEAINAQSYKFVSQDSVRAYEHILGSIDLLEKQKSEMQKQIELLEEENQHLKTCLGQRVDSELEDMIQKHTDLKLKVEVKDLRVKLMQALQFIESSVSDGFKLADDIRSVLDEQ